MKTTTKTKELRAMDEAKQRAELAAMLREQFNLRMQHTTGQLANNANLKKVRRNIARLRTVMSEPKAKA
jgi:large subunit ribosomal protein L29